MDKVLVIGSGGAGKSVFSNRLGQLLNIEVIHLDKFHWLPGWVAPPKDEWLRTVRELLSRDRWIMDGNFSGTLDVRIEACDTMIFLDMPRLLCLWRVLKRNIMYRNRSRPDMAEGCNEKLDMEFIRWIWNYSSRTRPKIVEKVKSNSQGKKIIVLRSNSEVEEFFTQMRIDQRLKQQSQRRMNKHYEPSGN